MPTFLITNSFLFNFAYLLQPSLLRKCVVFSLENMHINSDRYLLTYFMKDEIKEKMLFQREFRKIVKSISTSSRAIASAAALLFDSHPLFLCVCVYTAIIFPISFFFYFRLIFLLFPLFVCEVQRSYKKNVYIKSKALKALQMRDLSLICIE